MNCPGGYSLIEPKKYFWRFTSDVENPNSYKVQYCYNNKGKFLYIKIIINKINYDIQIYAKGKIFVKMDIWVLYVKTVIQNKIMEEKGFIRVENVINIGKFI